MPANRGLLRLRNEDRPALLPPHRGLSAMSLLRAFSALRLTPATVAPSCLCRALSTAALRPSPLLSLAARPALSSRTPLAQQVRTFKMPKAARKFSAKSPLSRTGAKTARKKGKRAVSNCTDEAVHQHAP